MSDEFNDALERALVLTDRVAIYLRSNLDRFSLKSFNYSYPHDTALDVIFERYTTGENVADFFHEVYMNIAPYCGIALKQSPEAIPEVYLLFATYWEKINRFYDLDEVVDLMERGVHYHPDSVLMLADLVNLYQRKGREAENRDEQLICVGSVLKYMKRIDQLVEND